MENPGQKKILVIERNNDFRESLSELLSLNNYQVINARNGYLGLILAREYFPDIIICARSFADISCWNVLQELRKEETTKQTLFVFLSSKPAGEEHQKMCEQEAVAVMTKPFLTEQLISLLEKWTVQTCIN